MDWIEVALGDIAIVKPGYAFKSSDFTDDPNDIPLVKGSNVQQQFIDWDAAKRIPPAKAEGLDDYHLERGDVVLAMDRPWVPAGLKVAWIRKNDPDALLVQRVARIRSRNGTNIDFIRHVLCSHQFKEYLRPIVTGVSVPHISGKQIEEFRLRLPPAPDQLRIATILNVYDDLIENNQRRIRLLEDMAQLLYREWFVHYRFPGHEGVEVVDSELGMIPEGWEVKHLQSFVSTQYGYTESAQDDKCGPHYLRGTDINKRSFIEWSAVPYCPIDEEIKPKFALNVGDILVIRMADPGKVALVESETDAVFASYLVRVTLDTPVMSPLLLFYHLLDSRYQDWISGASTGATRKSASAKLLTDYWVPVAPREVQEAFDEWIEPIRDLMGALVHQNEKLRFTRDLLLPRLISGELDVSELDIEVPT